MRIERVREYSDKNEIKWSVHCLERMQERDISRSDVKECIATGEVIEDYPEDFPNPSCLIFGYTSDKEVLNIVVGMDENSLYIITVYFPNTTKFEEDLKTRRRK